MVSRGARWEVVVFVDERSWGWGSTWRTTKKILVPFIGPEAGGEAVGRRVGGGLKAAIFEVEEGAALGRGTGEATSVLEVEGMRRLVVREEIGDLRRYDLRLSVGGDFWLGLVVGEDQPGGSRPLGT
jgi:hypothetical protein